ncbi:MAG: sodium:proton exchanger [Spirochaetaceae bacterium]|nr:sodium:proton exchanger [Spirochaetaceae bacterium]|tara:strand:+ start:213717 stop:215381 length:1665 start_codon:yes stop_codon:yes gene_type:complete
MNIAHIINEPFFEFALILLFAALIGMLGQLLRQPLIVMFIALGVILGPSALDLVQSHAKVELLAEIGISILLFIVGLKLDLRVIRSVGRVALITGIGQVVFTSLLGFFIALALGFAPLHSLYISVALTFSSTIIIVKLLSDKKEIDALHGQIAIGFLIVQDIVVILVMIGLSALNQGQASLGDNIIRTLMAGLFLVLLTFLGLRYIFPYLSNFLARSQELLTLFAVAWAISMAGLAEVIGLSGEVGAFLAGVTLASSQFKDVIASRLVSLRDFMLLFFFVSLGSDIDLGLMGGQVVAAAVLSAFVLIGNPIIVLALMGFLGYRSRTSFLAGLTVAQISEFSLILAGMGLAVGHITESVLGLITLVGLITIAASTYLILYSHPIYDLLSPVLRVFERKKKYGEVDFELHGRKRYDFIILGLGRFGNRIAELLEKNPGIHFLGVDFDPVVIDEWKVRGWPVMYGDIDDSDLMEHIPYRSSAAIIITISDNKRTPHVLQALRRHQYSGKVFIVMRREDNWLHMDSKEFQGLLPYQMAASQLYQSHLIGLLKNREKKR